MNVQLPSSWVEQDTDDNATSTATRATPDGGTTHFITSVSGGYTATKSGFTLILKEGTTEIARWYVYDSLTVPLPSPIAISGVANLELQASGTGGVFGSATMVGYTV